MYTWLSSHVVSTYSYLFPPKFLPRVDIPLNKFQISIVPSLGQPPSWWDSSWGQLLLAGGHPPRRHTVILLDLYLSPLFSAGAMVDPNDHALNRRSKEISWYSSEGYLDTSAKDTLLSSLKSDGLLARGLLISFSGSSSCFWAFATFESHWLRHPFPYIFSLSHYDGMESLAAPLILRHWILHTLERTYWSSLCGLAVLHYIGLKNILVDSEVGFLHALFSLVRLTRFHQDLGWLSCLRCPTFRHMCNLWSVFHRTLRPVLFFDLWFSLSSMFPSLWSNAPLVTGISNPMASLRRSSFYVHHWWRDSGMDLTSLTHSSAEDSFVSEFAWLIRSLFWPMIVNVAFHERGIVLSRCCSWLKGEPPGTRTLAAGRQKTRRRISRKPKVKC